MNKFEYKCMTINVNKGDKYLEVLNTQGEEGWELVFEVIDKSTVGGVVKRLLWVTYYDGSDERIINNGMIHLTFKREIQ